MSNLAPVFCAIVLISIASKGVSEDARGYVQNISSHKCKCVEGECTAPASIRVNDGFSQATYSEGGGISELLTQLITYGLVNVAADCFRAGDRLLTTEFQIIENEVIVYSGTADLADDWKLKRLDLN